MENTLVNQVNSHTWWHSINLGGGVITPGGKSAEICTFEAQRIFDRIDVKGRSIIDIGAWNGFFSFEAKRRGAARVLATDSYCWTHPDFKGRETFELARNALDLDIEAREIDVAELSLASVGAFDAVLFLGVFYHRHDAIDSLTRAANLATQLLVVETLLDLRNIDRPAMAFYPRNEINGDDTNWWGPNEHCMLELLRNLGFSDIEVSEGWGGEGARGIFHAWRSTDMRLKALPESDRLRAPGGLKPPPARRTWSLWKRDTEIRAPR